ncbi:MULTISPECIES: diacylglycerol kinase [Nosocomiicoccus]|uniref:Diacylglycerol kinase n=1 Tax=Nosocomiicoccus massiliensis TaxID=1232430 RepID=A0AAF1BSE9_9STAP|nr:MULTISPECIES: diacylglycerol kinase [Nosocomiicoccus]OFL48621.1 lipid kinase [Nosocomiicoccus sp. HMSC067E10]WOS96893.1 diacylglycerol kinase [Nosocomiicoccus massiliensis]
MKTARIIYNPTAGREVFEQQLPQILERLERAGYIASAHRTTGIGDAIVAAKRACELEFDLVIAVGGDGTVNEVINGLLQHDTPPEFGIIPMGTVNDFTRALGIPSDIFEALDYIIEGEPFAIDLGLMNGKYFMNIGGGGKITEVSYEAPSRLKAVIGSLAYYVKGIELIPQITSFPIRIEHDDDVYTGRVMLFLIGLTNSIGGFEQLVPDAELDDGYFSVLILEEVNLAELAHVLTLAMRGEHLKHDKVKYFKSRELYVSSFEEVQLNLDGELGGVLPAHFKNLQQAIKVRIKKE